jgi:hypothetical protein
MSTAGEHRSEVYPSLVPQSDSPDAPCVRGVVTGARGVEARSFTSLDIFQGSFVDMATDEVRQVSTQEPDEARLATGGSDAEGGEEEEE